jgi:hypothetical protein
LIDVERLGYDPVINMFPSSKTVELSEIPKAPSNAGFTSGTTTGPTVSPTSYVAKVHENCGAVELGQ